MTSIHVSRAPWPGQALLSLGVCDSAGGQHSYLTTTGAVDLAQLKALRDELDLTIARLEAEALDSTPIAQWPALPVTP